MVDKGEELHVFIEIHQGVIENVRVTSDEAEADNWENDWLHTTGYSDMDEYLETLDRGLPKDTMHTFVLKLE